MAIQFLQITVLDNICVIKHIGSFCLCYNVTAETHPVSPPVPVRLFFDVFFSLSLGINVP